MLGGFVAVLFGAYCTLFLAIDDCVAAEYRLSNEGLADELSTRLALAEPGDVIVLPEGRFELKRSYSRPDRSWFITPRHRSGLCRIFTGIEICQCFA